MLELSDPSSSPHSRGKSGGKLGWAYILHAASKGCYSYVIVSPFLSTRVETMHNYLKLLLFLLFWLGSINSFAAYYDTLPKGVRTFVYRKVETGNVDSSFNQKEALNPYSFNFKIDADLLASISQTADAIEQLGNIDSVARANLLIGEYEISGDARVKVDGFGFGWGLTNRVTAYGILPYYTASVNINYKRRASNNFEQVGSDLENQTGNGSSQATGQALGQIPDVDAPIIQYALTKELGYKDLGNWQATDFGDMELGLMFNLANEDRWGTLVAAGIVAPTGRVDDPDLLQDFSFGDGQWDLFLEFGGGYYVGNDFLINSFIRYTYQLPSEKDFRIPESLDNTLSAERGRFNEKLGNTILYQINSEFIMNDWMSVTTAYEYQFKEENTYDSSYGIANDILAYNTDFERHIMKLNLEFSSVKLFQSNEFLLPGKVIFGYQDTFSGVNTPKVKQYEIEFRMFF